MEFSVHHIHCKEIELRIVEPGGLRSLATKEVSTELESFRCGLSKIPNVKKKLKAGKQLRLHTHCGMQLLFFHNEAKQTGRDYTVMPYMGSSKKTCWHYERVLRGDGYFISRGCHGEILAQWTIETSFGLEPLFLFRVTEVLYSIQEDATAKIMEPRRPHQAAAPQSTAAVTTSESAATLAKLGFRANAREQSQALGDDAGQRTDPLPQIFAKFLHPVTAIRLPANKTSSEVVTLRVLEKGCDAKGMGISSTAIDFQPFLGYGPHRADASNAGSEREREPG